MAEVLGQIGLQGIVFGGRFRLQLVESKKLLVRGEAIDSVRSRGRQQALIEIVKVKQVIASVSHIANIHPPTPDRASSFPPDATNPPSPS